MSTLAVLALALGLIFVYLLLSLVCLAINEAIATVVNFRAQTLVGGLQTLLHGPDPRPKQKDGSGANEGYAFADSLLAHPLVQSLRERRLIPSRFSTTKRPSYIPATTFATVLIDTLRQRAAANEGVKSITPSLDAWALLKTIKQANLPKGLEKQLSLIVSDAQGDIARAKRNIERWFDDAMLRVAATYKTRIQTIGVLVAFVVCVTFNADTLQVARELSGNAAVRGALAAEAQRFAQNTPDDVRRAVEAERLRRSPADTARTSRDSAAARAVSDSLLTQMRMRIDSLPTLGLRAGLPGRQTFPHLPGILLTTLAVSLGAPFWFDLLNKVVTIRGAGRAPEEKPKSPEAAPPARGA